MTENITDIEGALRDYLRAQMPTIGVWLFDIPKGSATFPMVVITGRIGGRPDNYAPLDNARVSFSVWGSPGGAGRKATLNAASALVDALKGLDNAELDDDTFGYGATVDSVLWAPDRSDPSNAIPRYIVDASFMSIAAV